MAKIKAKPMNLNFIQVYAPTLAHSVEKLKKYMARQSKKRHIVKTMK